VTIDDLDTPTLLIDLDIVERNIRRMQEYCDTHDMALRPHIKTHKIPPLAHRQMAAGARGITCQKIGEAEIMAAAGLSDILITYNILGAAKLERLARLAHRAAVKVTADASEVVDGLDRMAARAGVALTILVECDTGGERAGVQTPAQALALAQHIDRAGRLRFGGLMTYPILPSSGPWLREARALLDAAGLPPTVISGGGTPAAFRTHEYAEITELRVGTDIYNDRTTVARGGADLSDCAQHVLATVVSRPTATRCILDAGSKTLTSDPVRGGDATARDTQGHGHIVEYPEATIYALSEEHGHVDVSACPRSPALGERVRVIANHACTVSNLFDEAYAHRNGAVEAVWAIAARGKIQ
jgi:D-serine deaminase-like pyridoxal phosphate-dependent protein